MKNFALFITFMVICLAGQAQEVSVGSFNIRLMSDSDKSHNDYWDQRKDMVCDLVAFMDFDAFGAQEVTNPQLNDMLARLPQYSYVGVGRDDGATAGEYSPVFYNTDRFVALKSGTFWLSETPEEVSYGWDAVCRRVCSYVQLKDKKTKQQFWFFNAHLDHIGVVARREGVKLILQRIHELAGDKANVVVTGDFNVNQFSEAYETIVSTGRLVDSYVIADNRFAPGGTFNGWDPANYTQSRIDHIFVSSDAKVSRYGILTMHYWVGEDGSRAQLKDAPLEIDSVKRSVHMPSDHYPINSWITFARKK